MTDSPSIRTARGVIRPADPIGNRTAAGFYWLVSQAVLLKVVGLAGQVALSWYLIADDFGVAAWASTVATFANLIQEAGLFQILVNRHARFRQWATPVFWLAVVLGLLAAAAMAAAAPIAAHVFKTPELTGLILLLALRAVLTAPASVPLAQLQQEMRFGTLSRLGVIFAVAELSLNILLASPLFRWGAFALVVPAPIIAGVRTAVYFYLARPPIRFHRIGVSRWKYVYRDSVMLTMSQALFTYTSFGDYLILGLFHGKEVVGYYYWAYRLSLQTVQLLTASLSTALFPAFSRLQAEPERLRQAFVRSANALVTVGVPLCLLQVAVAAPVVRIVFKTKWEVAVPTLQILSLGMVCALLNGPAISLLRARGQFTAELKLAIACGTIFTVLGFVGAASGGSESMAIAVSIYNTVAGLACVRVATGTWRSAFDIYARPLGFAAATILPAYLLGRLLPANLPARDWAELVVVAGMGLVAYAAAVRILAPDIWREFASRAAPLLARLRRSTAR